MAIRLPDAARPRTSATEQPKRSPGESRQPARQPSPPPPASAASAADAALRKRRTQLPYEIQYARKMLAEFERLALPEKAATWAQKLRGLEAELAGLASHQPGSTTPATLTGVATGTTSAEDALVAATADAFEANGSQDGAHKAILAALLAGKYGASAALPADLARALDTVRTNQGAPLNWIRNQQQADALHAGLPQADADARRRFPGLDLSASRSGQSFFVRDFMQVYSRGAITVEKLVVTDGAVGSAFASDFDALVARINARQESLGRSRRVDPFAQMAHRDAFQLIPGRTEDGIDHFAGAQMSDVTLRDNVVESAGALQGIFASDGAFRNLQVRGNHLRIGGQHTISISGMLSGAITGNTDLEGKPLPADRIALHPLRLGGEANVNVLSFRNKPSLAPNDPRFYQYEEIEGVPPERDFRRRVGTSRGAQYFRDVDMVELQALVRQRAPKTRPQWDALMRELESKGFARRVTS